MPVYVYRNLKTGETFEVEQRMVEPALVAHPVTGDPVKRLVQPVGIAFKGSGFYVTDSRSSSTRNGASSAAAGKGATSASTTASGEAGSSAASPPPTPSPQAAVPSGGAAD
jgi:predicted nucleic acid-binding Zn ribbon protein